MIALIIGYLFIGVCIAIGFILYDCKNTECDDIEEYLNWNEDNLIKYIGMGFVWPFSLILFFIMLFLPFIFKKLVIAIYKLISEKKEF